MKVSLILEIPDDACCANCLTLLREVGEEELEMSLGECNECGEEIILEGTIHWGTSQ